jgi:hypothetical protein
MTHIATLRNNILVISNGQTQPYMPLSAALSAMCGPAVHQLEVIGLP